MSIRKNIIELDKNTPCTHVPDLLIFRIGYDLSTKIGEQSYRTM